MVNKQKWRFFKEAKIFARSLGLKTRDEWLRWAKTDGRPSDIPSNPRRAYLGKGWKTWGDFLGTGNLAPKNKKKQFYSYEKAQKYVSKLGIKDQNDWRLFVKGKFRPSYIPVAPWHTYKNEGWISLGEFLGTCKVANKNLEFRSFNEAKIFARALNLKSRKEWRIYSNSGNKPSDIPSNPASTYSGKGWISWSDFLGNNNVAPKEIGQRFCSFEEAQDFIIPKKFLSIKEFREWAKSDDRPLYIPSDPQRTYKYRGWKGWGYFLGTNRIANKDIVWRPFREARAFVRSKGFKNQKEWKIFVDSDDRPKDIPKCPNETYANKGWISTDDWLGTDNTGWTVEKICKFVASLLPFLGIMTEADLYIIAQQNGLLDIASCAKGSSFVKAFITGRFPVEDLEKFVNKESSLVDTFLNDSKKNLEYTEDLEDLPIVETKNILSFLESDSLHDSLFINFDDEACSFLIKNAIHRIWKHAFRNEKDALVQLKQYNDKGIYAQEVKRRFLEDYEKTKNIGIPEGFSFPHQPNLMQLYTAYLVKKIKRIGNWSGTGAGKTLSAILASRVINAKITVICCPNNVIDNWVTNIEKIYPDSNIQIKQLKIDKPKNNHVYIILNYEFFQQPQTERKLKLFLNQYQVDFIIIDEIHFSKQREDNKMSLRRKVVTAFLSEASKFNKDLHVLGMSATPVINNLFEGKTLIELITGFSYSDLRTQATVSNCVSIYSKLVINGIRFVPDYKQKLIEIVKEIDCSKFLSEIKNHKSLLELEIILTKAKIPYILEQLKPKTIVYTHYRNGVEIILQDAIEKHGWKVGLFNGDFKSGLKGFIDGNIDILIASSCIGTGIDGLQFVCSRLIFNCLPWTHAEYKQIIGRIYRQGQVNNFVDIIIPLTFSNIKGERWSWCESRWSRIMFKKSIADAAVDGVIPEGHLRSKTQAHKDVMLWLQRLEAGNINESKRIKILTSLSDEHKKKSLRKIENFSRMNQCINISSSSKTHNRFKNNPQEWFDYHDAYREKRKVWDIIPYQEAIKWCKQRPHMIIGDFGCGEAHLAKELENKVYSFDHIAINDTVISCDISRVPLEDKTLDVAIFSLSLMGSNYIDYLIESYRCLKLDGYLWIAEPTSRIKNTKLVKELLFCIGFTIIEVAEKDKFTFIKAIKTDIERKINKEKLKTLKSENIIV